MKKLEHKWCASNYANSITLKKLTSDSLRFPRGTYHDTWADAHSTLIARREREFKEAEKRFQSARTALAKAKRMPPPAEPSRSGALASSDAGSPASKVARPDEPTPAVPPFAVIEQENKTHG